MIIQLSVLIISLAVPINSEHQCGISGINSTFTNELNYKEKVAEDGQWPWVVGLYLKNENQREYFCSGTLINNQYVLTAAHCIHNKGTSSLSPNQISITLGTIDTYNNNSIIVDAIEVKIHPEWNTNNNTKFDADLAIIKLNQTIEFSENIQPVCLPTSDEKVFEVNGFLAGFRTCLNENGVDGKLRYSKIPTVTQEKCLWHPGGYAEIASNRTFCGGDLSQSFCKGDRGKGLVVESKSGAFKIIGIVSVVVLNTTENCSSNSYAVFTNVPLFVEWILTETGRKDEIGHQVWNHYNSSTNIIPTNSIYVNEGNMKSYVARRKIGDDLIVGKFLQEWKSIFVPYYKGELNFHDEIEILASSKNHQWIPFNGTFPYNAVQGGYEGDVKLFVGRKLIDDKYVIGKIIDNRIYIPYFSKELSFDADFEILILSDEGWHSYSLTDAIPENSIYVDEGDEKTYVARRMHANNLIVGKFVPALKSIYLPFMGEELKFDDRIEVLVTSKQHQWIPFNDTIPTNAVLGGYEGKMKLYVGRKMHDGKNIIGKVIDTTKTIYIGYFSKEYAYTDSFEILVLN